jgi:hypothetical protein
MQTHSARHAADLRRNVRRHRRARFWVGVICVGIFAALSFMAYAGLDRIFIPDHEVAAAPPSEPNAAYKGTGHLVWVDSDGCSIGRFDNANGQLGMQQSVPCSQVKNPNSQHKQSPLNRFKRFNTGFQK